MALDLVARGLVQAGRACARQPRAGAARRLGLAVGGAPPLAAPQLARVLFALRLLPATAAWRPPRPSSPPSRAGSRGRATRRWASPRPDWRRSAWRCWDPGCGVPRARGSLAPGRAAAHDRRPRLVPPRSLPALLVETTFPVVAVLGLVRARLVVSRAVAEGCTAEGAVLAHELAHAGARNLRRLALAAAPDALAGPAPTPHAGPTGRGRRAGGRRRGGGRRWPALASALIKVARLATTPPAVIPASALYRGEPITSRVRRLPDPPAVLTAPAGVVTGARAAPCRPRDRPDPAPLGLPHRRVAARPLIRAPAARAPCSVFRAPCSFPGPPRRAPLLSLVVVAPAG